MVEGGDLLDGDLAPAWSVNRGTDDAVCALADDVEDLVLGAWQPRSLSAPAWDDEDIYWRTDVEAHLARGWWGLRGGMAVLRLGGGGSSGSLGLLCWHGGGGKERWRAACVRASAI